jgi:hypothetical protein
MNQAMRGLFGGLRGSGASARISSLGASTSSDAFDSDFRFRDDRHRHDSIPCARELSGQHKSG